MAMATSGYCVQLGDVPTPCSVLRMTMPDEEPGVIVLDREMTATVQLDNGTVLNVPIDQLLSGVPILPPTQ